jgi:hypothetical protein
MAVQSAELSSHFAAPASDPWLCRAAEVYLPDNNGASSMVLELFSAWASTGGTRNAWPSTDKLAIACCLACSCYVNIVQQASLSMQVVSIDESTCCSVGDGSLCPCDCSNVLLCLLCFRMNVGWRPMRRLHVTCVVCMSLWPAGMFASYALYVQRFSPGATWCGRWKCRSNLSDLFYSACNDAQCLCALTKWHSWIVHQKIALQGI